MLELLKVKASGFKLLEDNFELDFTTRTRVYQKDKLSEIEEIDKGLNTFRSIAFVGGNSSGKSTALSLVLKTLLFLQTGRWEFIPREFKKDSIDLNIVFYLEGFLYNYSCTFSKIEIDKLSIANIYSPITNEKLIKLEYNKARGIVNLDLLNTNGVDESEILKSSLLDTSAIAKITGDKISVDEFSNNNIVNFDGNIVRNTFFASLNSCDKELVSSIIKLLDESIEYIICDNSDLVKFKRINEKEIIISKLELLSILSSGTFRGVELYVRSINALKYGKVFIVDEIENCFHKNLVKNLLFIFNSKNINSKGAKLIFSTHYTEILDSLSRRDNIFITHKENGYVNVKNLYSDYDVRTELSKSNQFDNNVFNTSFNYEQLLNVKELIINDLHTNND
ncbi:MAG TPA: hypothetical protein DCX39_03105 [Firmicutes bacterium]|nr:hypothetical protein [Bacillota bacterium]HAX00128.1 hypothetical protein [Bacillota bacterium]